MTLTPSNDETSYPVSDYSYHWIKRARDHFVVKVQWNDLIQSSQLQGLVSDAAEGKTVPFLLDLASSRTSRTMVMLYRNHSDGTETFIDVTLQLQRNQEGGIVLTGEFPIADNKYFHGEITHWPEQTRSEDQGDTDSNENTLIIEAPSQASDLFPFIWLQPLSVREISDTSLRLIEYPQYADLVFYKTLLQAKDAKEKQHAAQEFRQSERFVNSLAQLDPSVACMPKARIEVLTLRNEQSLAEQIRLLEQALHFPEALSLTDYYKNTWPSFCASLWESVYCLGIQGCATDANLANDLINALRAGQYMSRLINNDERLLDAKIRQRVLNSIAVQADAVALHPPAPALRGSCGNNSWVVLGIGQLRMAQQQLQGYAAGEIADVLNIMPRERQESRLFLREEQLTQHQQGKLTDNETSLHRRQAASEELASTLASLLASEEMAGDLSGISPSYENLNMFLTGQWTQNASHTEGQQDDRSQHIRQLSELAAKHMGERVAYQRSYEWRHLRETRYTRQIDNSQHERLVGIYRWVDQLVKIHLHPQGSRLILSFLIESPAKPWLDNILKKNNPPLTPPASLPAPITGQADYSIVTRENYQMLGAQYGLSDLPAPPASTLNCQITLTALTQGEPACLCIPKCYSLKSGTLAITLPDTCHSLVCIVSGQVFTLPEPKTETSLPITTPVGSKNQLNTGTLPLPATATAIGGVYTLDDSLGKAVGELPITIMTSAPSFAVTLQALAELDKPESGNPLIQAWQIQVFQRLQSGWKHALHEYKAISKERIDKASHGKTAEIQRETLKSTCLSLLEQDSLLQDNDRGLAALFSWAHMTWQYAGIPASNNQDWPQPTQGETTQAVSPALFEQFINAQSARVLLPVKPTYEAWLLFYLQFFHYWAGGLDSTPITQSTASLMEELLCPEPEKSLVQEKNWTLRIPTALLYLQEGGKLPFFPAPI